MSKHASTTIIVHSTVFGITVFRGQCFSSYQILLVWLNCQEKKKETRIFNECDIIYGWIRFYFTWSTTSKHIPFEDSPNCLYWLAITLNCLRQSIQFLPTFWSLVLKHFIKSSVLFRMSITFLFNLQIAVTLLAEIILSGSHSSTKQPGNEK